MSVERPVLTEEQKRGHYGFSLCETAFLNGDYFNRKPGKFYYYIGVVGLPKGSTRDAEEKRLSEQWGAKFIFDWEHVPGIQTQNNEDAVVIANGKEFAQQNPQMNGNEIQDAATMIMVSDIDLFEGVPVVEKY